MKNYYAILGISCSAEPPAIREAYRQLAKRCHPDSSRSAETASKFREVHEAYSVLRDAKRRRQYDRRLGESRGSHPASQRSSPQWRRRSDTAPDSTSKLEELDLELSTDEARRGGRFAVPFADRCPVCGGLGRIFLFACSFCQGTGAARSESVIFVSVPPGCETYDTIIGYNGSGVAVADIRIVIDD